MGEEGGERVKSKNFSTKDTFSLKFPFKRRDKNFPYGKENGEFVKSTVEIVDFWQKQFDVAVLPD